MKLIKLVLAMLLAIAVLTAVFWTPDTSFEDMRAKYASNASQFLALESGQRLHFRDQGLRAGRTLVLIHGTSASLHTWEPLVEELKSDFRLVSLDLPGHGLSGENRRQDYSHSAMVEAVWQVMDQLHITHASLAGNSLGGAVAWKAAIDKPERVAALVLLAPSGVPSSTPRKSNIGFKILKTRWGQAMMTKITPRFLIMKSLLQTVENKDIITESMADRYWELLRLKGNRQAMIRLANIPRVLAEWERLSVIKQPTLIIWGREDGLLPFDMSAIFKQEIANSQLISLDKVGHIPMEEATDSVSDEILKFCSVIKC